MIGICDHCEARNVALVEYIDQTGGRLLCDSCCDLADQGVLGLADGSMVVRVVLSGFPCRPLSDDLIAPGPNELP